MDPRRNPFAPGAGTRPPELAGRDEIIRNADVALARVKDGRPARGQFLLGLRGVGKTVLLNHLARIAEASGYHAISLEAPEERALAELLVPPLRQELFALGRVDRVKELARRGLAVLKSFAKTFKVRYGEVEVEVDAEPGTADSGDLEADLPQLLLVVGRAAKEAGSAIAVFLDEVQYLSSTDLAALIVSAHKLAQKDLPFLLFGAGLPQLASLAGEAKSYSERLFEFPAVDRLDAHSALSAIEAPIRREGAEITRAALDRIVEQTRGYPYFLQEWGKHAWDAAPASPIDVRDVDRASASTLRALDESFFRVRLERLRPRELDYVRAMAELGSGPYRSGDIARMLKMKNAAAAGPHRDALIKKGMIYSPRHGDNDFTVPMFDDFMRRTMPDWEPGGR